MDHHTYDFVAAQYQGDIDALTAQVATLETRFEQREAEHSAELVALRHELREARAALQRERQHSALLAKDRAALQTARVEQSCVESQLGNLTQWLQEELECIPRHSHERRVAEAHYNSLVGTVKTVKGWA